MTTISLACMDMAGTTVLDDGAVMAAFAAALDRLGLEPGTPARDTAVQYTLDTMGQSKIDVFRAITGDEERAVLGNEAFEQTYLDVIRTGGAAPVPGAEETIRTLQEAGIRTALTTGFSAATRDALLDALGWTELVDLALSPSDAGRGRPFPDLVLAAVLRLGVEDVRDVAVAGDTTSDLLTGHRAGAAVVAGVLTGAHDHDSLASAPHTHVLASVADLPAVLLPTPTHA